MLYKAAAVTPRSTAGGRGNDWCDASPLNGVLEVSVGGGGPRGDTDGDGALAHEVLGDDDGAVDLTVLDRAVGADALGTATQQVKQKERGTR
jgi:hypothetical protein